MKSDLEVAGHKWPDPRLFRAVDGLADDGWQRFAELPHERGIERVIVGHIDERHAPNSYAARSRSGHVAGIGGALDERRHTRASTLVRGRAGPVAHKDDDDVAPGCADET